MKSNTELRHYSILFYPGPVCCPAGSLRKREDDKFQVKFTDSSIITALHSNKQCNGLSHCIILRRVLLALLFPQNTVLALSLCLFIFSLSLSHFIYLTITNFLIGFIWINSCRSESPKNHFLFLQTPAVLLHVDQPGQQDGQQRQDDRHPRRPRGLYGRQDWPQWLSLQVNENFQVCIICNTIKCKGACQYTWNYFFWQ